MKGTEKLSNWGKIFKVLRTAHFTTYYPTHCGGNKEVILRRKWFYYAACWYALILLKETSHPYETLERELEWEMWEKKFAAILKVLVVKEYILGFIRLEKRVCSPLRVSGKCEDASGCLCDTYQLSSRQLGLSTRNSFKSPRHFASWFS